MFGGKRGRRMGPTRPNVQRSLVSNGPAAPRGPQDGTSSGVFGSVVVRSCLLLVRRLAQLSRIERGEPQDARVTVRATDEVNGTTVSRGVDFVLPPREAAK